MKLQDIKLIIGLGNPGKEYEKTYHNVGFLFINQKLKIKNQNDNVKFKNADFFEYLKINCLILIKTKVFMNESGKAVKETIKYFKVKPEEILIIHDDSDIEIGKYKLSFNRGAAGHLGVQSIMDALGTKNFWRLRIGIRKKTGLPAEARQVKAGEMVLKKISKKDLEILEDVFKKSLENLF